MHIVRQRLQSHASSIGTVTSKGGSGSGNSANKYIGSSYCVNYTTVFNNLLRTMMLIVFGLANLNNGLTSHIVQQNNMNDELHRNINQKLIMSPSATLPGALLPPMEALTAVAAVSSSSSLSSPSSSLSSSSSSSQLPFPPAKISASSSSSSASASASSSSSSSLTATYQRPSGSSITSFDSTNVIDERQHQQEQEQLRHHYKNTQLAKGTEARPAHRIVGVGGIGGGGGSGISGSGSSGGKLMNGMENHLDGNSNVDGDDDALNGLAPMYFGTENSTVVTTQIGATAHIPCTVHHIGDGVVSWIRRKDYHLLTVGLTTYSSDERFSATHLKHSEDWTLQIKFVQLRDAGVYECQVSTHPPTSIFLHLNVVEARAEISGPPIRYLTPGSTLRLQCRVVQNTQASEFIFWYHDNRMINYDIDRGINVSTEPDFQSSELTILRTRREHSGNFTCVASNTQPASVLVHIFKGDNPAAMYHGHVGSSTKSYQTHLHSITAMLALGFRILHSYIHLKIV